MTPGTVLRFDLTQAEPEAWSLGARWGARFLRPFSGYASRALSIISWVDSLVIPSIVLIASDISELLWLRAQAKGKQLSSPHLTPLSSWWNLFYQYIGEILQLSSHQSFVVLPELFRRFSHADDRLVI